VRLRVKRLDGSRCRYGERMRRAQNAGCSSTANADRVRSERRREVARRCRDVVGTPWFVALADLASRMRCESPPFQARMTQGIGARRAAFSDLDADSSAIAASTLATNVHFDTALEAVWAVFLQIYGKELRSCASCALLPFVRGAGVASAARARWSSKIRPKKEAVARPESEPHPFEIAPDIAHRSRLAVPNAASRWKSAHVAPDTRCVAGLSLLA